MLLFFSHPPPPRQAALRVRWLVLVVIVLGTLISSIGMAKSHGLAAMAATHHTAPTSAGLFDSHAHGHAHGQTHEQTHHDPGDDSVSVLDSTGSGHPHHAIDHSHDKAHALPAAWRSASSERPGWSLKLRSWVELVEAYRLERPPMD